LPGAAPATSIAALGRLLAGMGIMALSLLLMK